MIALVAMALMIAGGKLVPYLASPAIIPGALLAVVLFAPRGLMALRLARSPPNSPAASKLTAGDSAPRNSESLR